MENQEVLDYSEYSIFKTEYGMNSSDKEYFYGKVGFCPFCKKQAIQIDRTSNSYFLN